MELRYGTEFLGEKNKPLRWSMKGFDYVDDYRIQATEK